MDKETAIHLKEYRQHIGEWKEKIKSCENLIADILQKEDSLGAEEVVAKTEHDFPNYAKYNKGTDV